MQVSKAARLKRCLSPHIKSLFCHLFLRANKPTVLLLNRVHVRISRGHRYVSRGAVESQATCFEDPRERNTPKESCYEIRGTEHVELVCTGAALVAVRCPPAARRVPLTPLHRGAAVRSAERPQLRELSARAAPSARPRG